MVVGAEPIGNIEGIPAYEIKHTYLGCLKSPFYAMFVAECCNSLKDALELIEELQSELKDAKEGEKP
jgi:hypothetical protein